MISSSCALEGPDDGKLIELTGLVRVDAEWSEGAIRVRIANISNGPLRWRQAPGDGSGEIVAGAVHDFGLSPPLPLCLQLCASDIVGLTLTAMHVGQQSERRIAAQAVVSG